MRPNKLTALLLMAAAISLSQGQNITVSPAATIGNFSSVDNLTTTTVPTTKLQETTGIPTNATPQNNATPGIKKSDCDGFEVFVLNNQLNIPYIVTCCITVLCGFYLVIFGKINLHTEVKKGLLLSFPLVCHAPLLVGGNVTPPPSPNMPQALLQRTYGLASTSLWFHYTVWLQSHYLLG